MRPPKYISPGGQPKQASKNPRIDILPQDFDDFLRDQGARIKVVPAMLCPNKSTLTDNNHVLDCPLCKGDEVYDLCSGYEEGYGYIQSLKLDKRFDVAGIFDLKDGMITTESNLHLGYWYKIEVLDFTSTYNQLVKRGSGDLDLARYTPVIDTLDAIFLCVDAAGVEYKHSIDYKIDGQNVRWLTATRPASGLLYTFTYPIRPVFRVIEMLNDNRYYYYSFQIPTKRSVRMPQRAVIRWDYLANKSGSNVPK